MRYLLVYSSFLCIVHSSLHGQRIENVKAVATGDKVIVTYDLIASEQGQKFKTRLFSSHDNYASSLSLVSGDVGVNTELTPGSKKIEWDAKSELKDFDGNITFEVRAEVIAAPKVVKAEEQPAVTTTQPVRNENQVIRITQPYVGAKHKRGNSVDIEWQGIPTTQLVKLELWKNGELVSSIGEISHRSSFPWSIPKNTKAGDYHIKLTSGTASVMSDEFAIRPRIPLLLKVLPVALIGGVAYVVLSAGDKPKNNGGNEPEGSSLPEPPSLPD